MYQIHLLPAAYGDAILVEYGPADKPHFILIDGGPYSDYKDGGPEELAWQAAQDRIVSRGGRLDLLVVTHVDADHIEGVVKLLNQPHLPFQPADVWFNGWDHLNDRLGAVEGELLSTQIGELKLPWNEHFAGRAVVCRPGQPLPEIELEGGMRLTLLSPTVKALSALAPKWEQLVLQEGLTPGKPVSRTHKAWPADLLGGGLEVDKLSKEKFRNDRTEANGSSIAFLAKYEGKACLFGADARSAILEEALKTLLQQRGLGKLSLNAFKLAHHGSKGNLGPGLLKLIDCQRYLVSTNGDRFGHPDDAALARILKNSQLQAAAANTAGQAYRLPKLCFNYRTVRTEAWEDADLQNEYAYRTLYPANGSTGLVIKL